MAYTPPRHFPLQRGGTRLAASIPPLSGSPSRRHRSHVIGAAGCVSLRSSAAARSRDSAPVPPSGRKLSPAQRRKSQTAVGRTVGDRALGARDCHNEAGVALMWAVTGPGPGEGLVRSARSGSNPLDSLRAGRHSPRLRASSLRSRASCSGAVRVRSSSIRSSSTSARR
jgi:hypothetical protein